MVEVEEYFDLFFYRPLAFLLVKGVQGTNITPNQITIGAIIIGLLCGVAYAQGPEYWVLGAVLFALYNITDCSDGMLARIKMNGTHAGRVVDGMADYISTAAAFIGIGIGGMTEHNDDKSLWWFLLVITAASNVVQSALVDYYRNRFLDYVLQRKSTFEEDYQSFVDEYESIKNQKGKALDRLIIRCYFWYSAMQRRIVGKKKKEKLFQASPQDYYRKNKVAVRLWVMIGPTSQITAQMICSAYNRMDIFFWLMLVGFNGIALIMWLVQKAIDRGFKMQNAEEKILDVRY